MILLTLCTLIVATLKSDPRLALRNDLDEEIVRRNMPLCCALIGMMIFIFIRVRYGPYRLPLLKSILIVYAINQWSCFKILTLASNTKIFIFLMAPDSAKVASSVMIELAEGPLAMQ